MNNDLIDIRRIGSVSSLDAAAMQISSQFGTQLFPPSSDGHLGAVEE